MSNLTKDYLGFTLNVEAICNLFAQDESTLTEMIRAIKKVRAGDTLPVTSKLGAANLGDAENPEWWGVFLSNVKDAEKLTFYRNNSHNGKGDRIQLRLRKQKEMRANTGTASTVSLSVEEQMAQLDEKGIAEVAARVRKLMAGKTAMEIAATDSAIPEMDELSELAIKTL